MPRVAIPVTQFTRAGVAPPAEVNGDPVNHHSLANSGKAGIIVRNAGASERILTIRYPAGPDARAVSPRDIPVPAGATRWVGPFPTNIFGTTVDIDVAHADLKLSAIRIT